MAKKPAASALPVPEPSNDDFKKWKESVVSDAAEVDAPITESDLGYEIDDEEPLPNAVALGEDTPSDKAEFTMADAVKMLTKAAMDALPDEVYDSARYLFKEFRTGYVPKEGIEREVWEKWKESQSKKEGE